MAMAAKQAPIAAVVTISGLGPLLLDLGLGIYLVIPGEFLWEWSILSSVGFDFAGMIVTSALIIWKGLIVVTGSESPVVVVLSGSMEPGFKRGDILFLHMSKDPIRTGEIVVFNVDGREIPIVHRVIKVHERQESAEVDILTKGDNNFGDDRLLYAHGQLWLQQHHIMGRAVGFLPYVGWVTIIMTEKPIIKYLLIGALGLLVITSKE
ncbi:hypothetical protein OsJ_20948 [Oryza sativa Japonica Group]|uniref:Signal peptidase complex catalytic subunit SEC11 n=1 Tax=Oryza sativa subsp. japonica TaxID=39947 RepID=A3BAL3_ORYSJ|nr:hypothetical protein OsJ_20948 [Oryza sativa Japonica Group]